MSQHATQDAADLARVREAINALRYARDMLKAAKCPRATERVRSALKSAEGAERAVGYRKWRRP